MQMIVKVVCQGAGMGGVLLALAQGDFRCLNRGTALHLLAHRRTMQDLAKQLRKESSQQQQQQQEQDAAAGGCGGGPGSVIGLWAWH